MSYRGIIMGFMIMLTLSALTACRPPQAQQPDSGTTDGFQVKGQYLEDLRTALAMEDQGFRQFQERMTQFEITWPYSEEVKASRMRIMKIQSIFRDRGRESGFTQTPVTPAANVEEALAKDAAFLKELADYYTGMKKKNFQGEDTRLIGLLEIDAIKYQQILEKHNGIAPADLKEYGKKLYGQRPPR